MVAGGGCYTAVRLPVDLDLAGEAGPGRGADGTDGLPAEDTERDNAEAPSV